jgi:hypothetical protein
MREHRNRHNAADGAAKLSGLTNGVHDLAKQFLVGNVVTGVRIASALYDLAAEAIDLVGGHSTKIVIKRIASFELFTVDQEFVRTWERVGGELATLA